MKRITEGMRGQEAANVIYENSIEAANAVSTWRAKAYAYVADYEILVVHQNKLYRLTANATATQVPGVSDVWALQLGGVTLDQPGGAASYERVQEVARDLDSVKTKEITDALVTAKFDANYVHAPEELYEERLISINPVANNMTGKSVTALFKGGNLSFGAGVLLDDGADGYNPSGWNIVYLIYEYGVARATIKATDYVPNSGGEGETIFKGNFDTGAPMPYNRFVPEIGQMPAITYGNWALSGTGLATQDVRDNALHFDNKAFRGSVEFIVKITWELFVSLNSLVTNPNIRFLRGDLKNLYIHVINLQNQPVEYTARYNPSGRYSVKISCETSPQGMLTSIWIDGLLIVDKQPTLNSATAGVSLNLFNLGGAEVGSEFAYLLIESA